jgi:hypothetical protein
MEYKASNYSDVLNGAMKNILFPFPFTGHFVNILFCVILGTDSQPES